MRAINLTTEFTATLTAFGADVINAHYAWMREEHPGAAPQLAKAGDTITRPLWSLMQIFGPRIWMEMPQVPFEGNVIKPA